MAANDRAPATAQERAIEAVEIGGSDCGAVT
jgi:hypothetical protein